MSANSILPNGKWFDDGKGVDFLAIILGLRSVKRFTSMDFPNRLNVGEHQFLGLLMVNKYCDFMAENFQEGKFSGTFNNSNFRNLVLLGFATHDVEEVLFGDLPSPIEFDGLDEIKKEVREKFRNFLNIEIPDSNAVSDAITHIDVLAAFTELCIYYCKDKDSNRYQNLFKYYSNKIYEYKLDKFIKQLSQEMYGILMSW